MKRKRSAGPRRHQRHDRHLVVLLVGLLRHEREWRDAPHTLMFVQAAATVRRTIDPAHQDYGDVSGYYAKFPVVAKLVRDAWTRHLDGQLDRGAALDAIADGLAAARSAK